MSTTALPDLPCYLNGEFSSVRDAKVSVLDRGFIFGDGIYEVVPVYAGRPFRLAEHLARLGRSLGALRIANPMADGEWRALVDRLIAESAARAGGTAGDLLIYIQVTRGVAVRDHLFPKDVQPTVFAMASRMNPVSPADRAQGVACITAEDFRWKMAHVKSISLAGSVLARQMGADAGAMETLMFRDGFLSEGAAVNAWVVKDGKVAGSPRDNLVLEGIRYGLMEELCREQGIPFALRRIPQAEVLAADEVLISSATKEILAVTRIDGQPVGNGRPGPIYEKLYAGYQRAKSAA
ncbi:MULTISPECIES: D-amino acid aminotransferase [Ramlibacter]|uniref:D-amino acid aminotransferase n=1 Tax=Ramlibacter aquaticus TaxID=2780094 RepID=A0ABR9SGM1_9BURK|nr:MULTISPECIES: D-amino acid aminotransferase [Ramlibacter]MBE7941499.1 D-amino acid aminotransferase [Ramlibacter aquaticus]